MFGSNILEKICNKAYIIFRTTPIFCASTLPRDINSESDECSQLAVASSFVVRTPFFRHLKVLMNYVAYFTLLVSDTM